MSAQVQLKLSPTNYETTVAVLQARYSELVKRIQEEHGRDKVQAEELRMEAGAAANALSDLGARIPQS